MSIYASIHGLMKLGSIEEQPYSFENRRILLLNKIAIVASLITTAIVFIHIVIGNVLQPVVVSLGFFVAIPALWFQSKRKYKVARNWFLTGFFILISAIFFHSIELSLDTSTEYVLIILIPLTLIFLDGKTSTFSSLLIIVCGGCFIGYRYLLSGELHPKEFYGLQINWFTASFTIFFCMNFFKKSLVRANQMIEGDRAQLSTANKTKNFLFGVISHDIRSPLNILKQYLQLDPEYRNDPKQFGQFQEGLTKKVDEISQTLDDLLFWSKSQLQGINANPSSFAIEEVTQRVIPVIAEVIEAKNIELKIDHQTNSLVFCDKDHLTVVIRNLVQNAIKFTPKGGKLAITSISEGHSIRISVSDSGKGMDEATLKNLQGGEIVESHLGTAGEVGTGLGLSLVKELIAKNKGRLVIESQLAVGTSVSVLLPSGKKS